MKKVKQTIVKTRQALSMMVMAIIMLASYTTNAQVAINIDGSNPDASAMLDVKSTDKGFLPPRVAQVSDVSSPAAGLLVYDLDYSCMRYYDGSAWSLCMGQDNSGQVVSATGKIWMDRNLGASQVATSSTDANAYGDLYQWGRATEGHESRNSAAIYDGNTGLASTAVPNGGNAWDGKFIKIGSSPFDWLSAQDDSLWQGVNGTNNSCPTGFRLPTEAEWTAERQSWSSDDAAGAFGSPLKLVVGGFRNRDDGVLNNEGSDGYYWSSTVNGTSAISLVIHSNSAAMVPNYRAYGFSVRCIRD